MIKRRYLAYVVVVLLAALPLFSFTQDKKETGEVKWYTIEQAQELMKKEKRKIYIDVYTDWCGWCKVMERNTFSDPKIAELLNTEYYAVKLNAEGKDDIVFKDRTFKYVEQGRSGYHELAAALLNGKLSYPTSVFLDENLNLIQPLAGYMAPEKLEPILTYLGEDIYKKQTWEEYMASRQ